MTKDMKELGEGVYEHSTRIHWIDHSGCDVLVVKELVQLNPYKSWTIQYPIDKDEYPYRLWISLTPAQQEICDREAALLPILYAEEKAIQNTLLSLKPHTLSAYPRCKAWPRTRKVEFISSYNYKSMDLNLEAVCTYYLQSKEYEVSISLHLQSWLLEDSDNPRGIPILEVNLPVIDKDGVKVVVTDKVMEHLNNSEHPFRMLNKSLQVLKKGFTKP